MEFWKLLWQVCLIGSMVAFAVMAICTTIGGARDIRELLRKLDDDSK
jgi:chemotaxis response regulator CheB